MNLKYMDTDEFKTRQKSFPFFKAEIFEYIKDTMKRIHAAYKKAYSLPRVITGQVQALLFWESKYHGRRTVESWNGFRLMSF